MMITRRNFIKNACIGAAALGAASLTGIKGVHASEPPSKDLRYGFLVDTYKCVGCGMCVKACKLENEIPWNIPASRTWVERYVVKKDGEVLADSPMAGRDGFTDPKIDQGEDFPKATVAEADVSKTIFVPKLCNQCDKPACVQVCPVGATYQTAEGIVLVDRTWCIGCGYCIEACPYGVRFFNPIYGTAEKCTWCYHRISKGMKPACVDACPFGARDIGNLKDPNDPVTKIIMEERVQVLKEEFGTGPQAFYRGLDWRIR